MEGVTKIRLPVLACSPPVAELHPSYQDVVKEIKAFYQGFSESGAYSEKELELLAAEDWPFLACLAWPQALESRLPWLAKFLAWFILFDDEADDTNALGADSRRSAALIQKYLDMMSLDSTRTHAVDAAPLHHVDGATLRDCTLLSCFTSLWEHFRSSMTPTQYARLARTCSSMFSYIAQQSKQREEGTVMSPAQMVDLKREVSMSLVVIPLMEYGAAIELDEHILALPEIREIEVACGDHIVLTNDILSFRREYNSRDFKNVPSAFCLSDHSIDLQTAINLTCELLRDADHKFGELYAFLSKAAFFTPQVKAFIDGLGYMKAGTLEWSWHTTRYHGLHWVAPPLNEREGIMYLEDPPRFKPTTTSPPPSLTPSQNHSVCPA